MSPEGVAAARRRIQVMLAERRGMIARAAGQKLEEFGARGAAHSSMYVIAIHRLCAEELDARAQFAWAILRSVLDNESWNPADDNLGQISQELTDALNAGSSDIDDVYARACTMISGTWPGLEEPRTRALQKALADAEIDSLGRRARHVPLLDALAAPRYSSPHAHWKKALNLAAASPPDHPNAIKEAVAAVESLAQVVLGKTGLTLGDAVKELRSRKVLPAGADKILDGLWAFANASPGTRHGGATPPSANEPDWTFARQIACCWSW